MCSRRACLEGKIIREMRALSSLTPLFAVALLLAWLLSGGRVFSFFQSPTSPVPPTQTPLPTQAPTETEVRPTSTATPSEAPHTLMPTVPPTSPPAEETLTPTVPPTSPPAEETLTPAAEVTAHPTVMATELPPSRGVMSLWPWVLLGLLSLGAITAGVFLLRREAPPDEGGP